MESLGNKRGQVAIWVVVALVIVVTIIIIYFLIDGGPSLSGADEFNPQSFIERCARDAVDEALAIILPSGGFVNVTNYVMFNGNKVAYLCQNSGNYRPCVNQHPMYLNDMKKEIESYISPRIENCFEELKNDIESKRGKVEMGGMSLSAYFGPGRVFVGINRSFNVEKNGAVQRFSEFKSQVISPAYDLALVAMEIASQEAKYCYFEYVGYMAIYPKFKIEKTTMEDSTKVYSIKDKKTEEVLNIATRGCTIPAGI